MKKLIAFICVVILALSTSSQPRFKELEIKKKVTIIRVVDEAGIVILQAEV